jgi:hypothetical protein
MLSALAEIRKDSRRTRHADLLHGSACGHLFVSGSAETMVTLTGAWAEARQTERFKAGMYRTEASGHCLGSLNRIPPKTLRYIAAQHGFGKLAKCVAVMRIAHGFFHNSFTLSNNKAISLV